MAQRRLIVDRPEYTRPAFTRGTPPSPSTTPVAHPSTRGVCVGGVPEQDASCAHAHAKQDQVDALLAQMAKLSQTEKQQLLDRAAAQQLLERKDSAVARDMSMWATAAYDAFCAAIGGPGAAGVGPIPARKLLAAAGPWAAVEQFMRSAGLMDLPVVDRQAVYMLLADLLVAHARSIARYTGAPFSIKLLANTAVNIAGVFDAAFPGYLEAGLAKVVARRHSMLKRAA